MKTIKDDLKGAARVPVLSPKPAKRHDVLGEGAQDVDENVLAILVRVGRVAIGWNQTELGNRAGITQRAIYQIERAAVKARKSTTNTILDSFQKRGIRFEKLPDGAFQIILPAKLFSGRSRQLRHRRR